jgi:flagellar hook protein FlgE
MKTAFHTGVTGLMAYQQMLDTTGNNIANVNTAGYKRQTTSFDDLLYVTMNT